MREVVNRLPPHRRLPRPARGRALPAAPRRRRVLVRVPLGRGAGGASTAVWRVRSANSDQLAGSLVFSVKGAAALLAVARFILLGALLVLVDGLAFLLLFWPDGLGAARVRRLLAGAWTAAVTAPLAGVPLHAVTTWGVPPAVRTFIRQPWGRLEENG